jgi:hypothetical protein
VRTSPELDSYERRILSRVGVGVIASLIGCALLGWGIFPVSFHGQTFADILKVVRPIDQSSGTSRMVLPRPSIAEFIKIEKGVLTCT